MKTLYLIPLNSMANLEEWLVPICICVILPVLIVWIVMKARKHEIDRRSEVMLKALEAGVPIDAELLKPKKNPKTIKENLMERLTGACITSLMGLAFLALGLWGGHIPVASNSVLLFAGAVMIAVGCGLFISFFAGRKMLAKEIEAEEKAIGTPKE